MIMESIDAAFDEGYLYIDNYYEEYLKGIEEYASECGISKVFCSEVLALTVDEVVQIHGGYGFVSLAPLAHLFV